MKINKNLPILIVEDDEDDIFFLKKAFQRIGLNEGLIFIKNGEDALNFLYSDRKHSKINNPLPKLIILDLNLPKVNGRELLKIVKKDINLKAIPIIVLTTSNNPNDIVECYKSGANTYFIKPSEPIEFYDLIETIYKHWIKYAQIL